MKISIHWIYEVLQPLLSASSVPPEQDAVVTSITTHSKNVTEKSIFVAIEGEKIDGHSFIEQAVQQKALAVLCKAGTPIPAEWKEQTHFFEIQPLEHRSGYTPPIDRPTERAFRTLAHAYRKKFSIPVIGVAGSVGKTTTKELLAAIFEGKYPNQVLKTAGSQNGYLGIPITLLELRSHHKVAVVEIGIDDVGAMKEHIDLVEPTSAVLSCIGPEHLENLINLQIVAEEEGLALKMTEKLGGATFINLDDVWIRPHASNSFSSNRYLFELDDRPLPKALENFDSKKQLMQGHYDSPNLLTIQGMGLVKSVFECPLLGKHNVRNLLAAICIARFYDLSEVEIQKGLKTFVGAEGRSNLHKNAAFHSTFLCDYYNANPSSMVAGLELLNEMSEPHSIKIACLGDMLELGTNELNLHRELALHLLELKFNFVLLFGPRMLALAAELNDIPFKGQVFHFREQSDLTQKLFELVSEHKEKALVLIKGSRGMKMETIWNTISSSSALGKTP